MKIVLKVLIVGIIGLLFLGGVTLFTISCWADGTFDYCNSNADAKKVFEKRIEYINTLFKDGNMATLKEEEGYTSDYYSQEYNMVKANEEMNIIMICKNNQLSYSFYWEKYGKNVNFEYTEQEIETVAKILNCLSKKKFSSEEIFEFINAEESKYSVEKYGFKKNDIVDKIKYINDFTKDSAFTHTIWKWSGEEEYFSSFSINGKFSKTLSDS